MPKVLFSPAASAAVDAYSTAYRSYFSGVFSDTGIWSQDQIVANYVAESRRREEDIFDLVAERVATDRVMGAKPAGSVIIPWKTRFLFVTREDRGDARVVTDLEIR